MATQITALRLTNFRSYGRLSLQTPGHLTIFVGPNAVGKTNIIEAIQLLTAGESFRRPSWDEMVAWDEQVARIEADFTDGPRRIEHVLSLFEGKREYKVNGKKRARAEIRGTCPSILFIPDHLQMVKAASAQRRDAVDSLGTQLSKTYLQLKDEYVQSLKQRNLLLKDEIYEGTLFDSWNERHCITGARLGVNRRRLFGRLAEHMSSIYGSLTEGEELNAVYTPSWARFDEEGRQMPDAGEYDEALFNAQAAGADSDSVDEAYQRLIDATQRLYSQEEQRKTSLVGPHKDDISLFVEGKNARRYCSQGQQRTIVLAWKLAEVEVVREILGQDPVLLLDDVMSELDASRRSALAAFIEKSAQTFMTTTNLGYFSEELLKNAHIVELPQEAKERI